MLEVHSGICGEHLVGKNMALKVIRHGVFWPTMRHDCEEYVKRCKSCQMYGFKNHRPSVPFNPTTTLCPFYVWGNDLVGPLPKSSRQCQFIIVFIDYFTWWVEAKPLSRIREMDAINFFMEHIVFRFVVPRMVVIDNGTQFTGEKWGNTLFELKIRHIKASVAYPEANGQVEITNKAICKTLRSGCLKLTGAGLVSSQTCFGVIELLPNLYRGNSIQDGLRN